MSSDAEFSPPAEASPAAAEQLLFVGFNSRVVALDRQTGKVEWSWKSPKGSGFVALLLDGDRLMASVQGYTYCLDPRSGELLWKNPLKGFGMGIPCLASARGNTTPQLYAALAALEQQDSETQTHTHTM